MLGLSAHAALAAPPADLVTSLPGFGDLSPLPFKVYSGYLNVPGPFTLTDYDALSIHYQLHTAQSGDKAPVATWHQGGPGGSSIDVGLYTEMGYFQISDQGYYANEFAWNKVAHMLYLESPAGSGQSAGYSSCHKAGVQVPCKWDDISQAEAYAHSLAAFFKAFPEYAANELFLTGESYFGQYGPNIASWILEHEPFNSSLNLKGIAAGNACWGGDATHVSCNGPNEDQMDVELFHRKALISTKLYAATSVACKWDSKVGPHTSSAECERLLAAAHAAVGPHNVYNLYDNCPGAAAASAHASVPEDISALELKRALRKRLLPGGGGEGEGKGGGGAATHTEAVHTEAARRHLGAISNNGTSPSPSMGKAVAATAKPGEGEGVAFTAGSTTTMMTGGYGWSCGGMDATSAWITSPQVRTALHLRDAGSGSGFAYRTSGPASVTLWPTLAKRLRVLIYNGDADACVPYIGNEEWIASLETSGVLAEKDAWRPWYLKVGAGKPPAGYVTTYTVAGASDKDFSFATIRLAGHMVPTFQPAPALAFFERFLGAKPM